MLLVKLWFVIIVYFVVLLIINFLFFFLKMGLSVNPPKKGDASFEQYVKEKDEILSSLKRRAQKLVKSLNELEGVSCQPASGLYF